jgi:transcriptional regulator
LTEASLYIPSHFASNDSEIALRLINDNAFATLISQVNGSPYATHLPLLAREDGERLTLVGHFARANPHWQHVQGAEMLAIFHGAHGYISPRWYVSKNMVPTWNYATVHCYGRMRVLDNPEAARRTVHLLSAFFEAGAAAPWQPEQALDRDFESKLLAAIVAFEIDVTRIETKLKVGQNRTPADQQSMMAALAADPRSADLLALTREVLAKR